MSNNFCRQLSNGYKINVGYQGLEWSPCCYFSKKTLLLDRPAFEKMLAYTSSAETWLPECRLCQQMEASGAIGLSPRKTSFEKIPVEIENGHCGALEINLDLMCNAACLSCGSYASTTWQKYDLKHKIHDYGPIEDRSDQYLKDLIENVPLESLQHLYILGGEPFYGATNLKLLQYLHQVHPALDQVVLQYQTNASISPDPEVLELWKSFKTVVFNMSLDGVGERFNYLRWPLKWHRVEKNVDFLLKSTNVLFNVNATVNPLSVLYFDEIEQWTLRTIPNDRMVQRLHNPVRANRCMPPLDLNLTTLELRQAVTLKYGSEHKLSKIFSNLEVNRDYQTMFDYIHKHDQLRRLDWRSTFSAVVKYYPNV
jgi:sulfatase maturation enzyme AslB (radical SAM superfamily)